jgi:hypothetical protein
MALGFGRISEVAQQKRADFVLPRHSGSGQDYDDIYCCRQPLYEISE